MTMWNQIRNLQPKRIHIKFDISYGLMREAHVKEWERTWRRNLERIYLSMNLNVCFWLESKKKQRSNRRSNYQRSHSIWIAHLHRNLASTREFARQQWQINAAPNAWNIFIGCVLALSAGHCQPAKKNQKRKKNALKSVGFLILSSISLFCT